MVRLRDGLTVLWRSPGEAQIGLDPRCGVIVTGLSDGEQRLLDRLVAARGAEPTAGDLEQEGARLEVPAASTRHLLDVLGRAGVLAPTGRAAARRVVADPGARAADVAYWTRLRPDADGPGVVAARDRKVAAVLGLGRLGMLTATGLAAAGVGTVLLADPDPVTAEDVAPGGFGPQHVGQPRQEAGIDVLRSTTPRVRTTAPPRTRPDLAVVVGHGAADPVQVRPLLREDVPHLAVVVGEVDVAVGPLVVPGDGPCLQCLDLHRSDADDRWPAVATQVTARPRDGEEASVAALAASVAVIEALAFLDGRASSTRGATLEVSAATPVPGLRRWSQHPDCGCAGPIAS